MFRAKTPVRQKQSKNPYTIHHIHDDESKREALWANLEFYDVISIDPGIENFCIRVERRFLTCQIIPLVFERIRFQLEKDIETDMKSEIYSKVTNYLDQWKKIFLGCHFVVVEQQLPINYKAVRLSQHVITYFSLLLRNTGKYAYIIEISPKCKGSVLGCPSNLNNNGFKRWCIDKAIELLEMRGDKASLEKLMSQKKKDGSSKLDDMSDVTVQVEALFTLLNLPLTQPIKITKLKICP